MVGYYFNLDVRVRLENMAVHMLQLIKVASLPLYNTSCAVMELIGYIYIDLTRLPQTASA